MVSDGYLLLLVCHLITLKNIPVLLHSIKNLCFSVLCYDCVCMLMILLLLLMQMLLVLRCPMQMYGLQILQTVGEGFSWKNDSYYLNSFAGYLIPAVLYVHMSKQ